MEDKEPTPREPVSAAPSPLLGQQRPLHSAPYAKAVPDNQLLDASPTTCSLRPSRCQPARSATTARVESIVRGKTARHLCKQLYYRATD